MQFRKILLVDDDAEDREIIHEAMGAIAAGDFMDFAENGEQALARLDKEFETGCLPCLVVLDLNMPRMNGTQTLKKLKADARFRDIPIIIYSTSVNPVEKEKCMQLGAYAYITKPLSVNDSLETARVFLSFCHPDHVLNPR